VREWGHHWHPLTNVDISDIDHARQCMKLLDALEALDDVRSVNANLSISEDFALD
jgi:transcriptional/translational regulatory protein YebC/TACO1